MKSFLRIFAGIFALSLFLACADLGMDKPLSPGEGTLRVSIGKHNSGRGVLSVATATENVNKYKIYIFDPSVNESPMVGEILPGETSKMITVPINDNYSVIVMAIGYSNDWGNFYLLGSGEQKNVAVTENNTTSVSITLLPVNFSYSVIDPPPLGFGSMTVEFTGNWGIDSIHTSELQWTLHKQEFGWLTESDYGYIHFDPSLSGTPDSEFTVQKTIQINNEVTSDVNKFAISSGYLYIAEGSFYYNWSWQEEIRPLCYSRCPESLKSHFLVDFTPTQVPWGLDLNIGWGEDY